MAGPWTVMCTYNALVVHCIGMLGKSACVHPTQLHEPLVWCLVCSYMVPLCHWRVRLVVASRHTSHSAYACGSHFVLVALEVLCKRPGTLQHCGVDSKGQTACVTHAGLCGCACGWMRGVCGSAMPWRLLSWRQSTLLNLRQQNAFKTWLVAAEQAQSVLL